MPGANCTRSLACEKVKAQGSHRGIQPDHPAFPHAMVLTALLRALPGDRAFLPPLLSGKIRERERQRSRRSGPHDFAVRFTRFRQRRIHVHRIPPRVRGRSTSRPYQWDETVHDVDDAIWG